MNQHFPQPLRKGDTIAIVSPSGTLAPELLHQAVALIEAEGYKVEIMPHVEGYSTSVFSATDAQRASDLEQAIIRTDVKAIICARGGYGAVRTLQHISDEVWQACNKWVVGFSDITALHSVLTKHGIASMHGPMLKHIALHGMHCDDVALMMQVLSGGPYTISGKAMAHSRTGQAQGILTGGNLSIVYSLRSTPADIDPRGKILFLEDLSEYNYHIDRMIQNLKYSGFLAQLSGLILGQFTGMKDGATPFGKEATEIITDAVSEYNYPVWTGFPTGHAQDVNMPLVMGAKCTMKLTIDNGQLTVDN